MIEIKNATIIIDEKSDFYKNCKRRRKECAKICNSCPIKELIEKHEQ
jgi:hypothetical protein